MSFKIVAKPGKFTRPAPELTDDDKAVAAALNGKAASGEALYVETAGVEDSAVKKLLKALRGNAETLFPGKSFRATVGNMDGKPVLKLSLGSPRKVAAAK